MEGEPPYSVFCISTLCGVLRMNKGLAPLVPMRQVMGKKNKPTTFRKSWLGLNISSRPLFMRSAPHGYRSDGKGRDKNLNVQGICEEFFEKSLMIGGKTVFLHQRHYYMETEQYIRDLQRRVRQLEHSHNVWTTVVTAIAVTMAFCAITSTYTEHKLRQQVKACSNMVENIK